MRNQTRALILFSIVFESAFASRVTAAPWPELDSDQKKLEYGLALRERVPRFFSDTFNYGIDWWSMAETQERMKRELSPLYSPSEDVRPLLKITLNETSEKFIPSVAQQTRWKSGLLGELAKRGASFTRQDLIAELDFKLREILTMKPKEILNSLLKEAMQKNRNFEIMKAPNAEKLAFLRANLPPDLSQTGFYKNSNRRYSPVNVHSLEHALTLVETIGAFEESVPALTALVALAGSSNANPQSSTQLRDAVLKFDDGDFVKLTDEKRLEDVLRRELKDSSTGSHDASVPAVAVSATAALVKELNKLMAGGAHAVQVPVPTLSLTEVPRDLSILRSTTALDCTHTCSFAKVDDPTERIFYVSESGTDKTLGYIEGQIKTSDRGDVFYLTSINGPTLTPKHAEAIINMIYVNRAAIGVQHVALAANNLGNQMNYQAVVDYFESLNHGQPRIQIRAKNPKIADIIDGALDADYQKEYQNKEAVIFRLVGDAPSTTVQHLENRDRIKGKIDAKKVLLFALELDAAQRTESAPGELTAGERAIKTANRDLKSYRELRDTLRNGDHLPYQSFLDTVAKEALARHGFEMDKAFLNAHAHVFFDAQLAASDAVEGSLRKPTLQLVAQLIKRGLWHPTWGLKEFAKDPVKLTAFNESKQMEGVMRWGLIDLNFHSIQMRNMVLSGIGLPQMREFEVVQQLLRIVADGWAWGPDLSREMLIAIEADVRPFVKVEDQNVRNGAKIMLKIMKSEKSKRAVTPTRASAQTLTCKDLFR